MNLSDAPWSLGGLLLLYCYYYYYYFQIVGVLGLKGRVVFSMLNKMKKCWKIGWESKLWACFDLSNWVGGVPKFNSCVIIFVLCFLFPFLFILMTCHYFLVQFEVPHRIFWDASLIFIW